MGRFAGLANVKTNTSGIHFEEGNYLVRLGKIDYKDTRKGPTFIVEAEVQESDNSTRGPGCKPSWVVIRNQEFPEYQLGDMKAFAGALMGIEDPDAYMEPPTTADMANTIQGQDPQNTANNRFWEETLEQLVSPEQPAKGVLIRLNVVRRESTRTPGKFHKRHTWGPVVK